MHDVTATKNFRANLRRACEELGISQTKLSSDSGIARPNVNRILQGHAEPSLETCEKLAEVVEIELSVLILHPVDFEKFLLEKISAAVA